MLNTLVAVVIIISFLVALRVHGAFTFVTAGCVGFFVYSLPAIIGLVYPFHFNSGSLETPLIPPASDTILVTLIAWGAFTYLIAFPVRLGRASPPPRPRSVLSQRALLHALLVIFIFGMLFLLATEGPFFFLAERHEQVENHLKLIWRWIGPAGLVLAAMMRQWGKALAFASGIVIYFISGDRTVIIITTICLIVACTPRGATFRLMSRPWFLTTIAAAGAIALLGKPIYLAVKSWSVDPLYYAFSPEGLEQVVKAFEPLVTYNLLDLVVRYDFQVPISLVVEGTVGQLLIVPSLFGIDSNSFNVVFTETFASMLTYGVAGNFWAQAYATGGYGGVIVFAVLYGSILRSCDSVFQRSTGAAKIAAALIGALFAFYVHRNSLDNTMAFVRQITMGLVLCWFFATLIQQFLKQGKQIRQPCANAY